MKPLIICHINLTLYFRIGLKYNEADLSAALMTEIFPELVHSTDIQFLLPSKKALRRFPFATVFPRPLPDFLNAQTLLSDRIRCNLAEIADIAMRRVPALLAKIDDRNLEAKWTHPKADETKWRTRTSTIAMRQRPNVNDQQARVAIIRRALQFQNRTSSLIDSRIDEHTCLSRSTLKESNTTGAKLASMNANESSNNRAFNSFNATSSKSSNNQKPDSLDVPVTTLNRRSNNTANVQQISSSPTSKARFSIKMYWTRT